MKCHAANNWLEFARGARPTRNGEAPLLAAQPGRYAAMAYFVIVPAFALWLLAAAAALVAAKFVPRLAAVYAYVLRILIWGTVGFVAANALLICFLALGLVALERTESSQSTAHDVLQMAWGLTAIGGP